MVGLNGSHDLDRELESPKRYSDLSTSEISQKPHNGYQKVALLHPKIMVRIILHPPKTNMDTQNDAMKGKPEMHLPNQLFLVSIY